MQAKPSTCAVIIELIAFAAKKLKAAPRANGNHLFNLALLSGDDNSWPLNLGDSIF